MPKLDQRGVVHFLLPLILLLGIIAGVWLITNGNPLKLFSKATNPPIVFKSSTGAALPNNSSGVPTSVSAAVKIEFTSTLGPPIDGVSSPVSGPVSSSTRSYKFAENPTDLNTASYQSYVSEPTIVDYTFQNSSPGQKFIWVEFLSSDGRTDRRSAQIEIVSASPSPSPSVGSYQRVFVTSTNYNGNLGGLSGADQKCQDRANAANLGGTWKAWLSDNATSASSRLTHSNLPYKLLEGTIVANNWDDLIDGTLQNKIKVTESGTHVEGWYVWTYTNSDGSKLPENAYHCQNWTSSSPLPNKGMTGNNGYTNSGWTKTLIDPPCSSNDPSNSYANIHLYCFEQTTVTASPTPISTPTPTPTPTPSITPTIPSATDNFDRSNNPSSLGQATGGQSWTPLRGTFGVSNNQAYISSGCPAPGYAVVEGGSTDGRLQVTLAQNTQDARIAFRVLDLNNNYLLERDGWGYHLEKTVNGRRTELTSRRRNATFRNGDVIRIDLIGANIRVFINDSQLLNVRDSAISGTKYGIGTWCATTMRFDNFSFTPSSSTSAPTPTTIPISTSSPIPTSSPQPFVCTACAADVSRDGQVNIRDFSYVASCYNRPASGVCASRDINGDGSINLGDINCLRSQFGKRC